MIDKDLLLEMIKNQEQVVRNANEQLQKLYSMAQQLGIKTSNNSIKAEIEAKRKQLFERVEQIRREIAVQPQKEDSVQNEISKNGFEEFLGKIKDMKRENDKKE